MELNQDNEPVAVYLHGPGIDNPIGMLRDHDGDGEFSENEVFIFTKDHLNSVRDLTNMNQRLVQRYNYSAYGKVKLERIADASDVRFVENYFTYTAREWEPEVGFICHRARCQEGNGRWISEDPIGLNGGDGNLYNGFKNNPITYSDPTGEFFAPGAVIGGILGGLSGAAGSIMQGGSVGQIAASAGLGATAGVLIGSGAGVISSVLLNAGANLTGQVISGANLSNANYTSVAISGLAGASASVLGALTGTSVSGAFGGSLAASSLDVLAAAVGIAPNPATNRCGQ